MKLLVIITLLLTCSECFAQANNAIGLKSISLIDFKQDTTNDKKHSAIKTTELKPLIIQSEWSQFQKDSLENRKLYHKVIEDAMRKPKVLITPVGISVDGVFSRLAELISGKRKSNKRFLKILEATEKENFIAIIYNTERVIAVNKTNDSLAEILITKYPMPYDFARVASPLEVDIWIRNNYRIFENEVATE